MKDFLLGFEVVLILATILFLVIRGYYVNYMKEVHKITIDPLLEDIEDDDASFLVILLVAVWPISVSVWCAHKLLKVIASVIGDYWLGYYKLEEDRKVAEKEISEE